MLHNNNNYRFARPHTTNYITSLISRITPTNDGSGNVLYTRLETSYDKITVKDIDLSAKIKAGANISVVPPISQIGFSQIDKVNVVSNNL